MANTVESTTLSKKKIRKSLSNKKGTPKAIRAVLASPRLTYRPIVQEKDEAKINELLNNLLPPFRKENLHVPWSELKNIPKNERSQFRKNFHLQGKPEEILPKDLQKTLYTGINAVTKALEKREVRAVLIASDIDPRIMLDQVIRQCIVSETPFLLVPSLRKTTLNNLKYSAIVLGFKTCVHFQPINDKIQVLSDSFLALPVNKGVLLSVSKNKVENTSENVSSQLTQTEKPISERPKQITLAEIEARRNKIYLFRAEGETKRVFVPPRAETVMEVTPQSDFLPFNNDSKGRVYYIPVNVKRIQKNVNRKTRQRAQKEIP